jgi:hypothetical protein
MLVVQSSLLNKWVGMGLPDSASVNSMGGENRHFEQMKADSAERGLSMFCEAVSRNRFLISFITIKRSRFLIVL